MTDNPYAAQLQQLLEQQQQMQTTLDAVANNIVVLYRRSTALALMLETISKQEGLRMPKTIRAEIDASLYPDRFEELAKKDPEEFKNQYGENTYEVFRNHGLKAICRLGDITTLTEKKKLQ